MENQKQFKTLAEVEKEYILEVLNSVGGSKAKAAAVLGITIKTVYNKLHSYAKAEIARLEAEKAQEESTQSE